MAKKKLKDLAAKRWLMAPDEEESAVEIVSRYGSMLCPYARVPLGVTTTNDDGDGVFDMSGADGLACIAIHLLPQMARFLLVLNDLLAECEAESGTMPPSSVAALRARLDRLIEAIDDRDDLPVTGYHSVDSWEW